MKRLFWLFLFGLGPFCYAQIGLVYEELTQTPEWSARAEALAGAYTAVTDSLATSLYNPAALSASRRFYSLTTISHKTTDADFSQPSDPSATLYRLQLAGQTGLNLLGFALPFSIEQQPATAGLFLRSLADLPSLLTWDKQGADGVAQEIEIKRQGALYGMSASFAASPLRQLSIGITYTLLQGKQAMDTTYVEQVESVRNFARTEWKNEFSGSMIEFGYIWNISSQINLAQKVTFPYTLRLFEIEVDRSSSDKKYAEVIDLTFPLTLHSGIAWRIGSRWQCSLDYRLRPWDEISVQWGGRALSLNFAQAHSWHGGLEYTVPFHRYRIPLRLGFMSVPRQIYEYNASQPLQRGNQVISKILTWGIGLQTTSWVIDLAASWNTFSFPADWYIISNRPFTIRQSNYHFLLTFHYLI